MIWLLQIDNAPTNSRAAVSAHCTDIALSFNGPRSGHLGVYLRPQFARFDPTDANILLH
jgi:hypothetical protein